MVGKGGDVAHTDGWPSVERLSCYQLLSDDVLDIKLMLWYYGKMNADEPKWEWDIIHRNRHFRYT